ncbi:hypothetical protein [Halobacteriovorax sp. CON-3]|uniref:hypothetical protein n=1 Tax=Halobacteriovorax sp. CON-3 TaxID=3157710 RepID=UPI0037197B30
MKDNKVHFPKSIRGHYKYTKAEVAYGSLALLLSIGPLFYIVNYTEVNSSNNGFSIFFFMIAFCTLVIALKKMNTKNGTKIGKNSILIKNDKEDVIFAIDEIAHIQRAQGKSVFMLKSGESYIVEELGLMKSNFVHNKINQTIKKASKARKPEEVNQNIDRVVEPIKESEECIILG